MKWVFMGAFALLLLLSAVAWAVSPAKDDHGRVALVWVSDDNPARREQIGAFNRQRQDIEVRLDPGNQSVEKVIVQSIGGVGPDLFGASSAFELSAYVKGDIAWDITGELQKRGLDYKASTWRVNDATSIWDGRVYGFPANVAADALWYREDLLAAEGITLPKGPTSWAEFLPLAQKLTKRDASGKIERFGVLVSWYKWPEFIRQWGGHVYSADGTRAAIDSREAAEAIEFMLDLMYRYHVTPSPADEAAMATQGGWGSGHITWFMSGRAATAIGGRWWLCMPDMRKNPKLQLGVVEAPYGREHLFVGYGRSTVINKHSPQREQALEFLLYQAGPTYNELINHQADALAPVPKYSYTDRFLHDPEYPEEDYNDVWRAVTEHAVPEESSLFVNGQIASRIINTQLDLVRNRAKSVPQALAQASREIDGEIARTLARDPALKERWQRLTGKHAPEVSP